MGCVPARRCGGAPAAVLHRENWRCASRGGRLGRDFWTYFTGQTISQVGSSFTNFALPLLVFKLTGSPTNLALTTAAEFVPYLLFGLVLGAVVDRVDRKRLMISVDLVRAAVIGVLPVLSLLGVLRVEEIYAVAFVQATMGILFDAGEFAAVPSLVGREELVTANARIMATNSAGQIVGMLSEHRPARAIVEDLVVGCHAALEHVGPYLEAA